MSILQRCSRLGAAVAKAIGRVLTYGLEQPVSGHRPLALRLNEALVHEGGKDVDDVPWVGRHGDTHVFGCLQVPTAGEDGQSFEGLPLRLVEQVVRPVDHGAQRPLAGQGSPVPAGQDAEPIVEFGLDLADRQRSEAGRGQLDRERDAVEPPAQRRQGRHLAVIEGPAGLLFGRPLHEQPDGVELQQLMGVEAGRRVGKGQ